MLKNQKTFSALECGLCKETECMYRDCYESMYSMGKRILVSNCKRLREKERKEKYGL